MKEKRKSLTEYELESKSRAICTAFTALKAFKIAKNVCVYMSAFKEPDTKAIIEECLKLEKNVSVPVIDGDEIYLCKYSPETVSGAYGIREPEYRTKVDVQDVDIFAVPALAFDKKGGRVGFGKGYYDSLLKDSKVVKAGLLYEFQLIENVPVMEHDILMDYLVTEKQVICCR